MKRRILVVVIGLLLVGLSIVGLASLIERLTERQTQELYDPLRDVEINASFSSQIFPGVIVDNAIKLSPEMGDLQAEIDQHPAGTIFVIRPGVYVGQSIVPRDGDTYIGEPGVLFTGAARLQDFTPDGERWVIDGQTYDEWVAGQCRDDAPRCNHAHALFFNNARLQHVPSLAEVTHGTWYFDYEGDRIYIGDDPTGHVVELTATFDAFGGTAEDVSIINLVIEKYAGPGQISALNLKEAIGWTIEGVTLRYNASGGVSLGPNARFVNNRVLYNGQIGVTCAECDNALIAANEIAYNNTAGYRDDWEAGGTKFVETENIILRGNYVHHNDGKGLWTDGANINTLFEDNLVVYNTADGIMHEISFKAVIRNNVVKFNSPRTPDWLFGAQILISTSSDVEVYGNEVVVSEDGGHGITVVEQNRDERFGRNNYVHDNIIVFLGNVGQVGAAVDDGSRQDFWDPGINRFDNNVYYAADTSYPHWGWDGAQRTWEEFRQFGFEENGRLSGLVPLDALVIPLWSPTVD